MEVGQIYCSAKNGNKARITLIDRESDIIKIEWFWVADEPCLGDKGEWPLSHIEDLVKQGSIQIYDELPKDNPNLQYMILKRRE